MRRTSTCRSAFTVIELAIAAMILAILTVAAWPDREADDQAKLDSALNRLESDIEYARTVALTSPADPTVLKMNLADDRYWIAKESAPDSPITNPATRKPYVVQLGGSGDASVRNVKITANNFGDEQMLVFDSSGGVKTDGSVGVEFQMGRRKASLKISPASAATRKVAGDLAALGLTNVVTDAVAAVADDDGKSGDDEGLISGLLGDLGLK